VSIDRQLVRAGYSHLTFLHTAINAFDVKWAAFGAAVHSRICLRNALVAVNCQPRLASSRRPETGFWEASVTQGRLSAIRTTLPSQLARKRHLTSNRPGSACARGSVRPTEGLRVCRGLRPYPRRRGRTAYRKVGLDDLSASGTAQIGLEHGGAVPGGLRFVVPAFPAINR
jgi:hypothetical protein